MQQADAGGPGYGSTMRYLAPGQKRPRSFLETKSRVTYNVTRAQTTRASGLVPAGGSPASWPDAAARDWVVAAFDGAAGVQAEIDQARAVEGCPLVFSVPRVAETVARAWVVYSERAERFTGYAEVADVVFLSVDQGTDLSQAMLLDEPLCRGTLPICPGPRPKKPEWACPHFHCALCVQQGFAPGKYSRRDTYVAHWKRCHSDVPATHGVPVNSRFCWLHQDNPTSEWSPGMSSRLRCEFHTDDPAKECHWHMSGWRPRDYLDLDGRKTLELRRYACSAQRREVAPSDSRQAAATAAGRTARPTFEEARIDCYQPKVVALVHAKMLRYVKGQREVEEGGTPLHPGRLVVGNMPLYATLQRGQSHPGRESESRAPRPEFSRRFWTVHGPRVDGGCVPDGVPHADERARRRAVDVARRSGPSA